ncbi:MAG: urea transporter [Myxococcota bacterium]
MAGAPERLIAPDEAGGRGLVDAFLRSYAQILFSRSRWVGALLLASMAWAPEVMLAGALAVVLSIAAARLLGLSPDVTRAGLYGYSALLVGLGMAVLFEPEPGLWGVLAVGVVMAVVATAGFHASVGQVLGVPSLTLPFLAVFWLILGALPLLGFTRVPFEIVPSPLDAHLPRPVLAYLQSFGAVFFLPRVEVGLGVALALLVHSRIAALLSVLGFAVAWILGGDVTLAQPDAVMRLIMGYNFMLTAVALGGIWFVPGPAAFLLALVGVAACGLVTLGSLPYLLWGGIPLLILPFNVTVLLVLLALRQRVRDGRPKAVDFVPGSPEQNLNYYRTRVARFGARYAVRIRAPFRGRWTVTQEQDGPETHRGPWRHALDFEILDADGSRNRGTGAGLQDYHCYRLPILAGADGTVVKVVDGVKDNPVGEVNLRENWGNLVLIQHGQALYSLVAHLAPGSAKVREGQFVRRGEVLGLCGNSGRSPFPHLHFQLQSTLRVGGPTLPMELHDVIATSADPSASGEVLRGTLVPGRGEAVRNLEPQPDLVTRFRFEHGSVRAWRCEEGRRAGRVEHVEARIELLGDLTLRSRERGAVTYFGLEPDLLTVFDTVGGGRSVLHLLHAALARVPFEVGPNLGWTDQLPLRHFLPAPLRVLLDFVAPFLPDRLGLEMRYGATRRDDDLIVEGASSRAGRDGVPLVTTRAVVRRDEGVVRLEQVVRGRRRVAVRIDEDPPDART